MVHCKQHVTPRRRARPRTTRLACLESLGCLEQRREGPNKFKKGESEAPNLNPKHPLIAGWLAICGMTKSSKFE